MNWEQAVTWLKNQPEQQDLVKACFFDDPILKSAERYFQSEEWREVRRFFPACRGKALDLGAGRGISSYALVRDGWDTIALEPDSSAVVGAEAIRMLSRESGLNIKVKQAEGEKLPFEDCLFDLVHCRQVLHHSRDLTQFCREIGRVLKVGGLFIATREHVISRKSDLKLFLNTHPLHQLYGGENAFLLAEYKKAIRDARIMLTSVINPFQSSINIFPETKAGLKALMARRIGWPWPALMPDCLLDLAGYFNQAPGRLYTFVGIRI